MNWSDIKEVFYVLGATAGVLALLRPVLETKFQRDQERLAAIRKLVDELSLVSLASRIDSHRQVPDKEFDPFRVLANDRRYNLESLRFCGPLAKYFLREVDAMIKAYEELREYVQVDEWEPTSRRGEDGNDYTVWVFNKAANAFQGVDGVSRNYAKHLEEAANKADHIRRAFQRLQVIGELHFYEVPFAGKLLKRRFKDNDLHDV